MRQVTLTRASHLQRDERFRRVLALMVALTTKRYPKAIL
jgi:hypothetical protein